MTDGVLRAEITGDPDVRGYAGITNQQVLDDLNLKRIDNWQQINSSQVFEAIAASEFTALTAADKARVDRILGLGDEIQTAPGTQARTELISVFGGGSATITALAAIANPQQTKAEVLGIADWLNLAHVADARS